MVNFSSKSAAKKKSVFRYSSYISSYQRFKELKCRFTTRFTKSYNLLGFKELQYVDLQLDLQELQLEKW